MKKIFYIFAYTILILTSCKQLSFDEEFQTPLAKNPENLIFNVSLNDVKTLVSILNKTDPEKQLNYIEPLAYNGDTLLYIVNYKENKGWKIVSGDRRTTSILASAADGVFKLKEINPGVGNWLIELADNISVLKQAGKQDTTMGDFTLWKNIDKLQESQVKSDSKSTLDKTLNQDEDDSNGYWELYNITSTSLPTTQVGPLLQTKWGQNNPWNTCVPTGKNTTDRCVIGCVAVAGAQTLHYLHYNIGVPVNAYTVGSCDGYSDSKDDHVYGFRFSDATSTAWDNMALHLRDFSKSFDLSGILMGWVGMNINMNYSLSESGTATSALVPFFNNIGINCTFKNYNSTEMIESLRNRKPVILRAYATRDPIKFLGITWDYDYKNGHAFVADGYETKQTKYTFHYHWIDSNGFADESYKTEESISTSNQLIINWGTSGSWDNGRYLYDGNWEADGLNFQYKREMIIGFSKK